MHRNIAAGACLTLALGCVPALATAQSKNAAPDRSAAAGNSGTGSTQGASSTAGATRPGMNHTDALAALQDARVTLARLTEASMSHDAREALARVSTGFRALYMAYTREEPTAQKSAAQAAGSRQPGANWEKSYDALSSSIDRIVGKAAAGQTGTAGTSGAVGAASGTYELTTPVRQEFERLRQQLQRFHVNAATGTDAGKAR
jgi:hypothetical protein